jgi:hypothetical protein
VTLPVLDRDQALASLTASSRRYSELVRSAKDPKKNAIGHWTIRDVAVHTSHLYGIFTTLLAGERSPVKDHLRLAEVWDAKVKDDDERDLLAIAERIDRSTEAFIDRATPDLWTREVWWHGDLRIPVYALTGILINEAEVHGLDIARAEDRAWSIARQKAIEATVGLLPILPAFVNEEATRGLKAAFELRLRGGPRVYITLVDGSLTIDATPTRVDCHVSADPVDYLLIGFGRRSQWPAIARGKVTAWGRKPWLALKFAKLFHSP